MQPPLPPPAMPMPVPVSGWQVGSTVATSAAAVIALGAILLNLWLRWADERKRATAQARLVVYGGLPGLGVHPEDESAQVLQTYVANHSDRAIFGLVPELWFGGADLSGPPSSSLEAQVAPPGAKVQMPVAIARVGEDPPKLKAWRIRWTDADGRQWCYDGYPQDTPQRFTGQPPRSYPTENN